MLDTSAPASNKNHIHHLGIYVKRLQSILHMTSYHGFDTLRILPVKLMEQISRLCPERFHYILL